MRTLPGALLLCCISCIAAAAAARPNAEKKIERREILQSPNGIIGVASIAGITNRNGRVSSLTGVRLLPATDAVTSNGSPFLYPLTVTKESNGKYASGSIHYYPGSIMVSSSASSGYEPDLNLWPKINMPLPSDMFFQPPSDFFETPKSINPWFPKEIFRTIQPPQINIPPSFIYPHFNPFLNLWR